MVRKRTSTVSICDIYYISVISVALLFVGAVPIRPRLVFAASVVHSA